MILQMLTWQFIKAFLRIPLVPLLRGLRLNQDKKIALARQLFHFCPALLNISSSSPCFLNLSHHFPPRPTTCDLRPALFKRPPILHANHPILRGNHPILLSNHPIQRGNHPRLKPVGR